MILEKDLVFIEFYVTVVSLLLQINDEFCDIAVPWKNQMEAWHSKQKSFLFTLEKKILITTEIICFYNVIFSNTDLQFCIFPYCWKGRQGNTLGY